MIDFTCETCGKSIAVRDEDGGKRGKCGCGAIVQVPTSAQLARRSLSPKTIKLGLQAELDLSGMSDADTQILHQKHASEMIQLNAEAQRLALGTQHLQKKFEVMNEAAATATRDGVSMRISDRTTNLSGVTSTEITTRSWREVAVIYALIGMGVFIVLILALVAMH